MMLRYFFLAVVLLVIGVVAIAGPRGSHSSVPPMEIFPDMNYQDKVKDQQPSNFFADGNSARPPIDGTVAEEMPTDNSYWATGKWDETHWGSGIPVHEAIEGGRPLQVDAANMARGRERYNISCAVCHGAAGDGKGIVTHYGISAVASYHTDRLRTDSDGDLFNTITNGHGQMLGYGYNITIDDRWRIVMYIRALQRSQQAAYTDASAIEQAQLEKSKKPATPPPAAAPATTPTPAPTAGPAPAKTTSNENHTGKFSFDVGYAFDGVPAAPANVLTPACKTDNQFNFDLAAGFISYRAPVAPVPVRSLTLGYDVRPQVYDLAYEALTCLALDLGEQWRQPGDVVRFVPPVVGGPLKLDYGIPYRTAKSNETSSHPVLLLSQATVKGWYDGYGEGQF